MKKFFWVSLLFTILIIVFWFFFKFEVLDEISQQPVTNVTTEYKNEHYKFSLNTPVDLIVTEYDETNDSTTLVFSNKAGDKGFQIFITPYLSWHITPERFARDIPSMVMLEQKDISIDNTPGTKFFSQDEYLGETVEVWFQRGDYLYEVTTLRDLEPWLLDTLSTWKFTS